MSIQPQALPDSFDLSIELRQKRARRRWWFIAAMGLLVPAAFVVVAVVSVFVWLGVRQRTALRDVQEEVVRIQSSGEPITTEDLYAVHRVPQGVRDVTPLWMAAFDSLDEKQFAADYADLPGLGQGSNSEDSFDSEDNVATAEAFLAKYDLTIQRILLAAQSEGECRFPVAFEDGMEAKLPHVQSLRDLARLLALRTRVSKARCDTAGSLESLHAIYSAARTLEHSPVFVVQLVQFAVAGVALQETEAILSDVELSDDQLARLQREVQRLKLEQGLTTALIGERAMGYHSFHHLGQLMDSQRLNAHDGKLTLPVDCRFFLEQMRESIEASRLPYPAALHAADRIESRNQQAAKDPVERFAYLVSLLIAPAYRAAYEATARSVTRRELVLCAIAAERYRAEQGHVPESLESLVPEFLTSIPIDPFNGQTVQFKASDEELTFYSVGKNTVDDGGIENDRRCEPDIVVRLRRR